MRRRDLLLGLGLGGAVAVPRLGRAQDKPPVIGYLHSQSPDTFAEFVAAFRQGLADEGFHDGRNLKIDYRWARGDPGRLPALAADLVARKVGVIATGGGGVTALAAQAATATIPIVFDTGADPVKLGLVASLAHPGGHITGYEVLTLGLAGKRLGLLREAIPDGGLIAALLRLKGIDAEPQLRELRDAAQRVGQKIRIIHADTPAEIDAALTPAATAGAAALLIGAAPLFFAQRQRIVALVAKLRLPGIYEWPQFVAAGGLMSYGSDLADGYRQVGVYTGKILKGAQPADLPVAEPTRFRLVINLKTAKALGLAMSRLLLAQADKVIQ